MRFWLVILFNLLLIGSFRFSLASESEEWTKMRESIRNKFPQIHQISTRELMNILADTSQERPIIFDARNSKEYQLSHLPFAQLAQSEQEAITALKQTEKKHRIIVYCSIGDRSSQLAGHLISAGFTNTFTMDGALFQWANEGRPIYQETNIVHVVHPYGDQWKSFLNKELWPTNSDAK
jgi:rhodanese-related sulfurtransferase